MRWGIPANKSPPTALPISPPFGSSSTGKTEFASQAAGGDPPPKIGRAAGRGRGEISVVAGSLKKKKKKHRFHLGIISIFTITPYTYFFINVAVFLYTTHIFLLRNCDPSKFAIYSYGDHMTYLLL